MNRGIPGGRLNIYLGNHRPKDGVRDYVSILRGICEHRGVEVGESGELDPAAVNIVIDEFTRPEENEKISRFKQQPGARLVFVLTEFVEQRYGVRSMNHFGGVADSALVAAANVWMRSRREDYRPARWPEWVLFWSYLPVVAALGAATALAYVSLRLVRPSRAAKLLARTRRHVGRLVYFHKRYAGLESHIHHADFLLAGHESIWPGLVAAGWLRAGDPAYAGVVYPELDEAVVLDRLRAARSPDIEITGSITSFRRQYIDRVNALIDTPGGRWNLGRARARPFGAGGGRAAYSLHPPQTADWRYASPTRLYRALQVDGTIPIITRHFGQHPLEDLCWRFKGAGTLEELSGLHADGDRAAALIRPRMDRYNAIAYGRNDAWMRALLPGCPAIAVRDRPLVSIIMPSYQQGRYIGEAISSVRRQSYPSIELLIVDGGSSDNTADVVRRHGRGVSCWISEPDEGTSDAINKGFARARGAYVWILNADDMLAGTGAVEDLVRYLDEHSQVDFVYGDMMMIAEDGRYIGLRRFPRYDLGTLLMDRRHLPFPGCLMRRRALAEVGGFDETLRYANDLDYFLRLARHRDLGRLGKVTGVFRIHGDASTQRHVAESGSEAAAVCLKYLGESCAAGSPGVTASRVKAAVYGYCASFNFHAGRTRETAAAVLSAFRCRPACAGNPKLWIYLAASLLGGPAMLKLSGVTRRLIRRRLFFAINNRGRSTP